MSQDFKKFSAISLVLFFLLGGAAYVPGALADIMNDTASFAGVISDDVYHSTAFNFDMGSLFAGVTPVSDADAQAVIFKPVATALNLDKLPLPSKEDSNLSFRDGRDDNVAGIFNSLSSFFKKFGSVRLGLPLNFASSGPIKIVDDSNNEVTSTICGQRYTLVSTLTYPQAPPPHFVEIIKNGNKVFDAQHVLPWTFSTACGQDEGDYVFKVYEAVTTGSGSLDSAGGEILSAVFQQQSPAEAGQTLNQNSLVGAKYCEPSKQTVQTNQNATLKFNDLGDYVLLGGARSYIRWNAPGGSPSAKDADISSGMDKTFTTKFSTTGRKNVELTMRGVQQCSASTNSCKSVLTSTCVVDVVAAPATIKGGLIGTAALTITELGKIRADLSPDSPVARKILLGEKEQVIGKFRFIGFNEGFLIEKLGLIGSNVAGQNIEKLSIKYRNKSGSGRLVTYAVPSSGSVTAQFQGEDRPYVPKDGTAEITVIADFKSTENGGYPGIFMLGLDSANFKALGEASSNIIFNINPVTANQVHLISEPPVPVINPISNGPAVTVTSPNGGENWVLGSEVRVTWRRNWMPQGAGGLVSVFIRHATGSNQMNQFLAGGVNDQDGLTFFPNNLAPGNDYKITVTSNGFGGTKDSPLSDESDGTFTISASQTSTYTGGTTALPTQAPNPSSPTVTSTPTPISGGGGSADSSGIVCTMDWRGTAVRRIGDRSNVLVTVRGYKPNSDRVAITRVALRSVNQSTGRQLNEEYSVDSNGNLNLDDNSIILPELYSPGRYTFTVKNVSNLFERLASSWYPCNPGLDMIAAGPADAPSLPVIPSSTIVPSLPQDKISCTMNWGTPGIKGSRVIGERANVSVSISGITPNGTVTLSNAHSANAKPPVSKAYTANSAGRVGFTDDTIISASDYAVGQYVTTATDNSNGRQGTCSAPFEITAPPASSLGYGSIIGRIVDAGTGQFIKRDNASCPGLELNADVNLFLSNNLVSVTKPDQCNSGGPYYQFSNVPVGSYRSKLETGLNQIEAVVPSGWRVVGISPNTFRVNSNGVAHVWIYVTR